MNSDVFEELKFNTRPRDLLDSLGIEYDDKGSRIELVCPFHDDNDPSLNFYVDTSPPIWKCYGCSKSGSVLDFIMHLRGVDVVEAAYELSDLMNIDIALTPEKKEAVRKKKFNLGILKDYCKATHLLLQQGRKQPETTVGTVYSKLKSRRFINDRIIDDALIGFGGFYKANSVDKIAQIMTQRMEYDKDELLDSGLFIEWSGELRNKYIGCYTMPYIDRLDRPRFLSARLFELDNGEHKRPGFLHGEHENPNFEPPRYLQLSRNLDYADSAQLYNENIASKLLDNKDAKNSLIITEGQFDALAATRAAYPSIALSGTSNTDRYVDRIVQFVEREQDNIDEVYIAYDREDTSKLFTEETSTQQAIELAEELAKESIMAKIVKLPQNLLEDYGDSIQQQHLVDSIDLDELLRFEKNIEINDDNVLVTGKEIFNKAVRSARTIVEFKMDMVRNAETKEEKANILRNLLGLINHFDELVRVQYIDELDAMDNSFNTRTLKRMLKEINNEQVESREYGSKNISIAEEISKIEEDYDDKNQAHKKVAELVINKIKTYGRNKNAPNIFFYSDDGTRTYLLFDGEFIEIDKNNKNFQAMISKFAEGALNTTSMRGRAVVEELSSHALNYGEPIEDITWNKTITETDDDGLIENLTTYFPLANKHNELIKLGGDEPKITPNAVNEDNAIIKPPVHMNSWEYNEDVDIEETMSRVKEVVWDKIALPPNLRLFILASMFSIPMIDVLGSIAHIRLQGKSGSGKSKIGKIITTTLLGEDRISQYTDAALRSLLENSPLVCIDEFERDQFDDQTMRLIRLAVTRSEYNKMSKQNENEVITQNLKSMIYTTGIDRLTALENRNRAFVAKVDPNFYADDFFMEKIKRRIKKFRDDIMSCMIKITNDKVIPEYIGDTEPDGESLFYKIKDKLKFKWGDHPISRLFDHLSLIAMYAKELSKYMPPIEDIDHMGENPPERGTHDYMMNLLDIWLGNQSKMAWRCAARNSKLVTLFDSLKTKFESAQKQIREGFGRQSEEYPSGTEYMREKFNVRMREEDDEIIIEGTINEIYQAVTRIGTDSSITCPFKEPGHFYERLLNGKEVLRRQGWKFNVNSENIGTESIDGEETYIELRKKI